MELLPAARVMAGDFGSSTFAPPATFAVARGEPIVRVLPNKPVGTPLPDSKAELPPVIRRAEVVAFALVALLIICIVAVLYVAKAFFLPVVTAFVVGTMLSPAAGYLERR